MHFFFFDPPYTPANIDSIRARRTLNRMKALLKEGRRDLLMGDGNRHVIGPLDTQEVKLYDKAMDALTTFYDKRIVFERHIPLDNPEDRVLICNSSDMLDILQPEGLITRSRRR